MQAKQKGKTWRFAIYIFVALQAMDLITTLAVFSRGGVELNPVVRSFMPLTGEVAAIVLSKLAITLLICLLSRRIWLVRFANVLYTVIVAWNVAMLYVPK